MKRWKKNTKQKPQQQQQWNSVNLFDWGEKKILNTERKLKYYLWIISWNKKSTVFALFMGVCVCEWVLWHRERFKSCMLFFLDEK